VSVPCSMDPLLTGFYGHVFNLVLESSVRNVILAPIHPSIPAPVQLIVLSCMIPA
jgi:hypothetical protein